MAEINLELMRRLDGFLLASFPRSGSTLTCQYLAIIARSNDKPEHRRYAAGQVVPTLLGADVSRDGFLETFPLVMRTHDPSYIAEFKTIFLFRRPDDSLMSYYFQAHKARKLSDRERFFELRIPMWREMAEAALDKVKRAPTDIKLMSYETYIADPAGQIASMLGHLGLESARSAEDIAEELNSNFRRKVAVEADVRQPVRGAVGASEGFFTESQRDRIKAELTPLYEELQALAEGRKPKKASKRSGTTTRSRKTPSVKSTVRKRLFASAPGD